jgi:hypothetical protein
MLFYENPGLHSPKRRCTKCGVNKYLTNTFFPLDKKTWTHSAICRQCKPMAASQKEPNDTRKV